MNIDIIIGSEKNDNTLSNNSLGGVETFAIKNRVIDPGSLRNSCNSSSVHNTPELRNLNAFKISRSVLKNRKDLYEGREINTIINVTSEDDLSISKQ
jgi:hypothetical protein